jgi:UDP-N-acetylglucosamine--N-acetylmuramyl-(pentapeptide) pyrophosphoryl-undecaprenol N-acetylglucosamine transferase
VRVLLAGGGTAGHIEPALATADALLRLAPDARITMLGTARGLETRLVPARGYPLELVPAVPLPRRLGTDLARVPGRLRSAVEAVVSVIDRTEPDVVVGFGGYVTVPAYLAARRRRVPIVVHEANARPGVANRLGARLTTHVAVASAGSRWRDAVHIGMPLRSAVSTLDRAVRRGEAAATWGLSASSPTLLVFGGSQGAQRLNRATVAAAPALLEAGVQVLHAAGTGQYDEVMTALHGIGAQDGHVTVPYIEAMELAYAAADLAVCRSGAMTVAELTAVGLPAVYVPLPIGNGEQRLNATPVVAAGGGELLEDGSVDGTSLAAAVLPLLADPDRLSAMGAAARSLGRRDADVALARMVLAAAR